mmetsp:Transcript_3295/g.8917  ORF Transcript_3295/g.8917 Transcript_3295/m.8917 type:complete len:107 (+) Transcript_3295:96-416(+)
METAMETTKPKYWTNFDITICREKSYFLLSQALSPILKITSTASVTAGHKEEVRLSEKAIESRAMFVLSQYLCGAAETVGKATKIGSEMEVEFETATERERLKSAL